MQNVSNILLEKEILLEAGTNELEVLVFGVGQHTFGINVAKVREVLPRPQITKLPRAHGSVRGVFKLRNQVVPVVSLVDHLGIETTPDHGESTVILTDLNQQQTAFLVDRVERIHRLSWQNILAAPAVLSSARTPITAVARCDSRLIVMLDFELILDQVTQRDTGARAVANPDQIPRNQLRLVLADDSPSVREAITATLRESGYTQLRVFENGSDAWNWLEAAAKSQSTLEAIADLLISDVEMPQMDGFHLTKKVKEHSLLGRLPVLLYSSIVTPDNLKKGRAVGADAQVAKPELGRVVELADQLISKQRSAVVSHPDATKATAQVSPVTTASPTRVTAPVGTAPVGTARSNSTAPQSTAPLSTAPTTRDHAPQAAPVAAAPTTELSPPPAPLPSGEGTPSVRRRADSGAATPAPRGDWTVDQPAATPTGVSPTLWRTFRDELDEHGRHLRSLSIRAAQTVDDALVNEFFRTLHTVKSAASVLPLESVVRSTHLMESLWEFARLEPTRWPRESLDQYLSWIERVAAAHDDARAVLQAGAVLEADLSSALVQLAAH